MTWQNYTLAISQLRFPAFPPGNQWDVLQEQSHPTKKDLRDRLLSFILQMRKRHVLKVIEFITNHLAGGPWTIDEDVFSILLSVQSLRRISYIN